MTTRTDDYDEIVRVVQLYVDAFNDNDISKLGRGCGVPMPLKERAQELQVYVE